jgi:hypothetical protein
MWELIERILEETSRRETYRARFTLSALFIAARKSNLGLKPTKGIADAGWWAMVIGEVTEKVLSIA